jgi:ferredoxin
METLYTIGIFVALIVSIAVPYWLKAARRKREALKTWEKNVKAGTVQPVTLHPRIDVLKCIGCAACVRACPEGVLGVVDGVATILSGTKCIGHGLCADACPVSGITLGFGAP